ncbi:MAG: metallophosphoesterase [Bacteroidales bacterium]|nr:metallophosphoesterase [Bacteroidales bacterium]
MAKEDYIWAIGDIHGYAVSLRAILNKISEYPFKRLIFLGDYIDRGPEPKEVLDTILSLSYDKVTLMGEHEYLLLSALEGEELKPKAVLEWSKYGYESTLKAFDAADVEGLRKKMDPAYYNFFTSLKLFHTESFEKGDKQFNLLFSHAGPFVDFPLDQQLKIDSYEALLSFMKAKSISFEGCCLLNTDKMLQRNLTAWDNYLLVHGHIRTQYRQNRNRLQFSGKGSFNFDFSDIPNPLYYPGGAAVSALDIDTGVDVGGKLTAVGFCYDNIDFRKGKINIKVIQADSSRRSRNVNAIVFDLSLPFTDEIGWLGRLLNRIFNTQRKKIKSKK